VYKRLHGSDPKLDGRSVGRDGRPNCARLRVYAKGVGDTTAAAAAAAAVGIMAQL
jgi:hypothetical protein